MIDGKKINVVVPVHNPGPALSRLLKHLEGLPDIHLDDVIVVDDGSTDGIAEILQKNFPAVRRLVGDGNLLWTGAMKLGMSCALDEGADRIFWLNHDCFPMPGSFERLCRTLEENRAACVSAWCFINGYPGYPVNPGFRKFRPIPASELSVGSVVRADGLNGNFVCFASNAVRNVGLPEAARHPHYGDGPYSVKFSRTGQSVLIDPQARAELTVELERRLSPFWRVAVSEKSLKKWLFYYLGSFRSQYHWRYRWNDSLHYRGPVGAVAYVKTEVLLMIQCFFGAALRAVSSRDWRVKRCIKRYSKQWPVEKLRNELA
jgi:glycosyltransferase involved in cell wall biosynthesis